MVAFADGPDADRVASSYKRTSEEVGKATKLKIKLAPGGGWAARLTARRPSACSGHSRRRRRRRRPTSEAMTRHAAGASGFAAAPLV